MRLLASRLVRSLSTWPSPAGWVEAVWGAALFAAVALPLGLASGVLRLAVPTAPLPQLLLFTAVAVVAPALAEEVAFRALWLPHPAEAAPRPRIIAALAVSLACFVAWHPVNAWLFLPTAWPVFANGWFLALAAWLGVCCAGLYLRTGSLWPGVALHWLTVVAWKCALGGGLVLFGA
jgi:predicted Abi (CAAX) family protease